jgi:hypothetical protein
MTLKRIRLELARTKDYPDGSSEHGYEFRAPLQPDGHIDLDAWESVAQLCTVHHFWGTKIDERGQLIRTSGNQWAFSYELGEDDDEPIFRFDSHVFAEGEYVTITEHDGEDRAFKVVAVADIPSPGGA